MIRIFIELLVRTMSMPGHRTLRCGCKNSYPGQRKLGPVGRQTCQLAEDPEDALPAPEQTNGCTKCITDFSQPGTALPPQPLQQNRMISKLKNQHVLSGDLSMVFVVVTMACMASHVPLPLHFCIRLSAPECNEKQRSSLSLLR